MLNKAKRFRELMDSKGHFFLMEAHNGMSAKIAEEAGFPVDGVDPPVSAELLCSCQARQRFSVKNQGKDCNHRFQSG